MVGRREVLVGIGSAFVGAKSGPIHEEYSPSVSIAEDAEAVQADFEGYIARYSRRGLVVVDYFDGEVDRNHDLSSRLYEAANGYNVRIIKVDMDKFPSLRFFMSRPGNYPELQVYANGELTDFRHGDASREQLAAFLKASDMSSQGLGRSSGQKARPA